MHVAIDIRSCHNMTAFALIEDINGFTRMVKEADGECDAQFIRDILFGGVAVIEKHDGNVVVRQPCSLSPCRPAEM